MYTDENYVAYQEQQERIYSEYRERIDKQITGFMNTDNIQKILFIGQFSYPHKVYGIESPINTAYVFLVFTAILNYLQGRLEDDEIDTIIDYIKLQYNEYSDYSDYDETVQHMDEINIDLSDQFFGYMNGYKLNVED